MKIKLILVVLLAITLADCERSVPQLGVYPGNAPSGELVKIALPGNLPAGTDQVNVFVKDVPAEILQSDKDSILIMLPELPPGKQPIVLRSGEKILGNAEVTINEHPSLKLVLKAEGDQVRIIGSQPTNTKIDTAPMEFSPFSFEFRSGDQLLSKGVVDMHSGSGEVFADPSGKITRQDKMPSTFSIVVPNHKGTNQLLLFRDSALNTDKFSLIEKQPWKTITFQN